MLVHTNLELQVVMGHPSEAAEAARLVAQLITFTTRRSVCVRDVSLSGGR